LSNKKQGHLIIRWVYLIIIIIIIIRSRSYYKIQVPWALECHGTTGLLNVNTFLYKYSFYCTLRTHSCWRVPMLFGKAPRRPGEGAPAEEKGMYALFMMILFRPHRSLHQFVNEILGNRVIRGPMSNVWEIVYQSFESWRAETVGG